jgi:2-polyprenyl-6-methoxyphenol hydroxylase-like FAD-dependent oxidoreductase
MSEILRTDVAIVGAGLVGLAAAVAMHQAGFSVVLIDSMLGMQEFMRLAQKMHNG